MNAAEIVVICVIGQNYDDRSIGNSMESLIARGGHLLEAIGGLIADQYITDEGDQLLLTEKGQAFFKALQEVPEPVATWTMPWNVE